MARKPTRPPIVCEYFVWRLFERDGVLYADGRCTGKNNLGKHSLGTRDPEKALAALRLLDRQKAVERGLASPTSTSTALAPSVNEGWNLFLAHCERPGVLQGVAPRTAKRYKAVRDKHVSFCERQGLASWDRIDKDALESYGRWLHKEGYADRSVFLELTLIKSLIRWLIERKKLAASHRITDLPLRKPEGTDAYCFRPNEVSAMVAYCQGRKELDWLAAVIVALACTGVRISELAALRWADIDFRAGSIWIRDDRASSRRKQLAMLRTTKGRTDRKIPLHADLQSILLTLPRQADGLVFHGPRGARIKPDTVRIILSRDVLTPLKEQFPTPTGETGFEHATPHSFRHYFCSQAFASGANAVQIKDWLGHKDSTMVEHYRHVWDDDSQRQMQRIDFLGGSAGTVPAHG
jgi:integrase